MKVLVTGGAGFVGSRIVELALAGGHEVAVIDNFVRGKVDNVDPRAEVFTVDVRDRPAVHRVFEQFRPDVVTHQAALVDVTVCEQNREETFAVNVGGTIIVLEACEACGVQRLVFASSAGAYGECEVPAGELFPLRPCGAYAESKRDAEQWLLRERTAIPVTILRYSNVYGPGTDSGVIPAFLRALGSHERPTIYGDGEQVRDFVHVDDVAFANLLALEQQEGPPRLVLNIASGRPISVNQLWALISARHMPLRGEEVVESRVSVVAAQDELGFVASATLKAGLMQLAAAMYPDREPGREEGGKSGRLLS